MNIYDLEKLAREWRELDDGLWPSHWPKAKRTLAYMDKCEVASLKYRHHAGDRYMGALDTIKKCRAILDSEYPDHDPRHPSQWLDQKLKELEEVEP